MNKAEFMRLIFEKSGFKQDCATSKTVRFSID